MSRTLLAVVVLVVAIAPIARAEEIPPGGVSSVPSPPVVGGPAPPEPLSPAPPLRNYADAFAVGDAFTDLGSDRARKIVNEAMSDVKAQASKLPKGAGAAGRAAGRAAAKKFIEDNKSRLAGIEREVKGAERWGKLGDAFDVANLAMGTWKEGRVGAEKAVANKILGDSSTWMGVQAGAAFGSCLGPGGAAAGALVGGLAGSLCYGKLLQERVEKNIEAEAARRQRDEAYRERVRKEVASDLEREIAEREREEARRSHEQFKAWQKQRADLEAFVAAQKAKERVDAGGTWGAGGGAAVQDRPPDSGWGAGGGAALQDRPSGSGRVPPAPAVDTPPVSSGTGGGWRPSQPQTVIVMPPSQPVAPPPPFLLPPPQLAEPRRGAPPTPGGSTGGRASSTAPPTRPPAGQGQAGGNQNCHEHDAQLQRLMAEQQRLLRQTQTAQVQQNPGQQRAIACQIVTNSNQVLNLLQHLRSVGCPVRGDLETAIRSGGHWQSLCSGR